MDVRQLRGAVLWMGIVSLLPSVAVATRYVPQHPTHTVVPPFTVQEFLHKGNHPLFLKQPIVECLSKHDLPYVYDVLRNTDQQGQWDNALLVLCVLEEGPRALEMVVALVTKPWKWTEHPYQGRSTLSRIDGRIRHLWNLSMMDPAWSVPFLSPLLAPEGATTFLESWGALPLPGNDPHEIDYLVGAVQRAAAYGLMYSRSPMAITPITAEFQRQPGMTDMRGYWTHRETVFMLAEVLGVYDLLEERGWEAGTGALRELHPVHEHGVAAPFIRKRLEEVASITDAVPHLFWKRVVVRHAASWLGLCTFSAAGVLGILIYRRVRPKRMDLPEKSRPAI